MLQRAASNAYSWWWASHIRTKHTKWLEQSLQDMDERVQTMLKLIEGDGDSFAKRAEMYYKRRPELITSVEEAYKQFKAMADRYDHLSKELQNANHTIATVFPEQVQFALSEDEDGSNVKFPQIPVADGANVPKVPKAPIKDLKDIISRASKKYAGKKSSKANKIEVKSGLTEEEAVEEINKLQKDILALQTVKEFVKSSYETGISKYLGFENRIMEMQEKVSRLQDEFNMGSGVIEDDEARTLMALTALKSCQETLAMLEEKQEKSSKEAKEEYKRIEAAYQRLQTLRRKYCQELGDDEAVKVGDESQNLSKDVADLLKETNEIEGGKIGESLDFSSISSLTVSQLAEKIDLLVNKVITLETAVSSQTVLVNTLRSETDNLNAQIQNLEEENANLINDAQSLSTRVKEVEEKLNKVQDLNKSVDSQSSNLQTSFAQTRTNLDQLSEKLTTVTADEDEPEAEATLDHALEKLRSLKADDESEVKDEKDGQSLVAESEDIKDVKEVDVDVQDSDSSLDKQKGKKGIRKMSSFLDRKLNEHDHSDAEAQENAEGEDELNWHQMLLNGMEDGEKILLREYTAILRHYKEVKQKLNEMEKKERESQFDTTLQIRDLKKAIQKRDEEIIHLRRRLNALDTTSQDPTVESDASEETENKSIDVDRTPSISRVEEKLRSEIDSILDENLDFWFRFSTAFHEVQKFKNEVKDLQNEITKLKEKRKADGALTSEMKSEVLPIYKHLREIQRELTVWLDRSVPLRDELNNRFASLCSIQEGITVALKEGAEEEEIKFSSHQAAKLQGEILNMKQENEKVREELQAGLDQVSILQLQIEKTLRRVNEEFGISSDQPEHTSKNRIPLRSFLFGTKLKKQKNSIFTFMHPSKRHQILRASMHSSNQTSS